MIEESLACRLITSYKMSCNFHEEYSNYGATFLRPLFKSDESWHLLYVTDEFGGTRLSEDKINRLSKKAMEEIPFLFLNRRISTDMGLITLNEDKWVPMYFRTTEESKNAIEKYLVLFCEVYLKKEINKKIHCDVKFDIDTSSINFIIPFTYNCPAIHINTVLNNWDKADVFVEEITNSLKNFFPSKNENYFKSSKM